MIVSYLDVLDLGGFTCTNEDCVNHKGSFWFPFHD